MELLDTDFCRRDGRTPIQYRSPIIMQTIFPNLSGSCKVRLGGTSILTTVHGPVSKLYDGQKFLNIELVIAPEAREKTFTSKADIAKLSELSSWLEEVFVSNILADNLPNSVITARIVVEQDDGSVLANCVTSLSIALMDAEVPMKSLLVGTEFTFFEKALSVSTPQQPWLIPKPASAIQEGPAAQEKVQREIMLIDPLKYEEENGSRSHLVIVTNPYTYRVVGSRVDGQLIPTSVYPHLIHFAAEYSEAYADSVVNTILPS